MTSPTLTDFLLARIAEDEEVAKRGQSPPVYAHHGDSAWEESYDMAESEGCSAEGAAFIEHMSPARVLAECEAKRRIVEEHPSEWNEAWRVQHCPTCSDSSYTDWAKASWPCATLLALATIYADHPDFNPEWTP